MPILDVEIVGQPGEHGDDLPRRLAEAAGEVLRAPPGGTWVLLRYLQRERYAESGDGPPAGVRPVFVRVLRARVPSGRELAEDVAALTEAIARECERAATNVHVVHEPAAAGRVAFGGRLVEG